MATREDMKKWKYVLCSWNRGLNIIYVLIFYKLISKYSVITNKRLLEVFVLWVLASYPKVQIEKLTEIAKKSNEED